MTGWLAEGAQTDGDILYDEDDTRPEGRLNAFKKVDVFDSMIPPAVVAEFKTFQGQIIQLTIDADGIIRKLTDVSGYDQTLAELGGDVLE
jgi:hypothetical protein